MERNFRNLRYFPLRDTLAQPELRELREFLSFLFVFLAQALIIQSFFLSL